jgi:hypothetical protein
MLKLTVLTLFILCINILGNNDDLAFHEHRFLQTQCSSLDDCSNTGTPVCSGGVCVLCSDQSPCDLQRRCADRGTRCVDCFTVEDCCNVVDCNSNNTYTCSSDFTCVQTQCTRCSAEVPCNNPSLPACVTQCCRECSAEFLCPDGNECSATYRCLTKAAEKDDKKAIKAGSKGKEGKGR